MLIDYITNSNILIMNIYLIGLIVVTILLFNTIFTKAVYKTVKEIRNTNKVTDAMAMGLIFILSPFFIFIVVLYLLIYTLILIIKWIIKKK